MPKKKTAVQKLEEFWELRNPRFLCFGAGDHQDKQHTAFVDHALYEPPKAAELELMKKMLGNECKLLQKFYQECDGARLFEDKISNGDFNACAFEFSPIEFWPSMTESLHEWVKGVDVEEELKAPVNDEHRENLIKIGWLRSSIAFGEVPNSGNYFLVPLQGPWTGKIVYFNHDFYIRLYAETFDEMVDKILADPAGEIKALGCYARYCDGETEIQWIPKEFITDTE